MLAFGVASLVAVQAAAGTMPPSKRYGQKEIAVLEANIAHGAVVYLSGTACDKFPGVCTFMGAHMRGHDELGHGIKDPGRYSEQQEREADCWAAQNTPKPSRDKTIAFFKAGGPGANFPLYGNLKQRADLVSRCTFMGNAALR